MKHFIIKTGFNPEDFIEITEKELDKAIYCHISGVVGVFENGTVRGTNIISIKEDWHKQMGWNRGYKLGPDDFQSIATNETCQSYKGLIADSKHRVNHLLSTGRQDLIGKVDDIKKLTE